MFNGDLMVIQWWFHGDLQSNIGYNQPYHDLALSETRVYGILRIYVHLK